MVVKLTTLESTKTQVAQYTCKWFFLIRLFEAGRHSLWAIPSCGSSYQRTWNKDSPLPCNIFFPYLPLLLWASSSILLLRHSFTGITPYFLYTKDQQISRIPPGLHHQTGAAETPSLGDLTDLGLLSFRIHLLDHLDQKKSDNPLCVCVYMCTHVCTCVCKYVSHLFYLICYFRESRLMLIP